MKSTGIDRILVLITKTAKPESKHYFRRLKRWYKVCPSNIWRIK
ncbi:hypothetical protein NEIMUCOT_04770 [Neisseria mucosa ATCC 25996]|uniref:Uncharacterized protein n=1 Tax=Neisseria mucosa (strain ATCC 25996 / DSM 4631 / NCTC 10774 / M26) TaxID=546266 RepID=D2ZVX7_NEIM2|nr:hypothetical protein NEIMUCOT_04770 [Neisseria mucosa ATCC 25996]